MRTYSQVIGDLYDESDNPIDRVFYKTLIDLDFWWYKNITIGIIDECQYHLTRLFVFLRLRGPITEFEFMERSWSF